MPQGGIVDRIEIEAQIVTLENDVLPDLRESLAQLIGPDYDPAKDADHEYRDQDIEFLEKEIAEAERELAKLKRRLISALS